MIVLHNSQEDENIRVKRKIRADLACLCIHFIRARTLGANITLNLDSRINNVSLEFND